MYDAPMRAVLCLLLLAGCVSSGAVDCPFGTCPQGTTCDLVHARCVEPDQLTSCVGLPDETECMAGSAPGICVDEVCLTRGCGDLRVNGAEQCDGERFAGDANDCEDIGFYGSGPIACNDDCSIDETQCAGLSFCGDGVVDTDFEACDFMAADTSTTCAALGYYTGATATCTPFCRYRTEGVCSERCGDGIVNGPELCEPTLGIADGVSCIDFGYDSGALACASTCSAGVQQCHQHGIQVAAVLPPIATGIWQASQNDVFVVAQTNVGGRLLRWNGSMIDELGTTSEHLLAVSGSSPANVIAVGVAGTILRYDGTNVVPMAPPAGLATSIVDVHVLGPGAAYAVGDGGAILALAGTTWSIVATAPSGLRGVWASSAQDVWAVGMNGLVMHYDGTAWTTMTSASTGVTVPLNDVWARAPNDVYVVGDSDTLRHYDGTSWTAVNAGATGGALRAVWGSGTDDVLVAGTLNRLLRFDGIRWARIDTTQGGTTDYEALSGVDRTTAVVRDWTGRLLRWEGIAWSPPVAVHNANPAQDIWAASAADVYAIAANVLRRFDGVQWSSVRNVTGARIWGSASNDLYIAASNGLEHFDGTTWSPLPLPVDAGGTINAVGGAGGTVYALTKNRNVVQFANGNATTLTTLTTGSRMWVAGADELFVAGDGEIHHYAAGVWSTDVVAGPGLSALWGTSPTDVWAVGLEGRVLHYDGTAWTPVVVPTTRDLRTVHGTAPNDIFVAGTDALLHFDGTRWSPVQSPAVGIVHLWATPRELIVIDEPIASGFPQQHSLLR